MDELAIVNGLILPTKGERYAGFVMSPKARRKFVQDHFKDFDPAVIVELPSGSNAKEEKEIVGRYELTLVQSVNK